MQEQDVTEEENIFALEARARFRREGLPFPPVPAPLLAHLTLIGPWQYGTRPGAPSLYDLSAFFDEVLDDAPPEYALLGVDGHGVQSYAMHFYLVRTHLALLLQLAWGGIYTDNQAAAERIETIFAWAEALIAAVEEADGQGCMEKGERLFVVESDFQASGWAWLRSSVQPDWQRSPYPIEPALSALRERCSGS